MGKQRRMARRQCVFDAIVDQQQQQHAGHHHPTHCHELVDDDEKFELTVDVPGVKEENIDIKLEDGMLTVQGNRTASSESSQFTSKFSKTFSLDKTVDVDKMSAAMQNGVLTVSAPKDLKKLEENIRRIPITTATAVVDTAASSNEGEKNANTSSDDNDGSQKTEQHKEKEEEAEKLMDAEKEKTSDSSKNGKE